LYVVLGKEGFNCKEAVTLLLNHLLPKGQRETALSSWDGSQADSKDLLADLYAQSFFVEKRVILIQQAEKLKKNVLDELEKYVKRTPRSQYLILSASALSRQTSFYKAVEKEGVILEYADLKPWEKEKGLIDWVGKQAAVESKQMPYQVCQQFVKQIGSDQYLLASELEKLFCFVGQRNEITWQDIEQICIQTPLETIWQLGESIFRRDAAAAFRISRSLIMEGHSFLPLLRQVRNQFVTEYHVCALLEQGKQPFEITQEYSYMKGQILERHMENARQYGMNAFRQGLLDIDSTELLAKNSQIDEQLLAEILIAKLTRPYSS
ncbi:MAG: DNA polymerase III subunit delta, partial [Chlamydiales bacterium]